MEETNLSQKLLINYKELFGSDESLSTHSESNKKRDNRHITMEQKEFMANYIIKNPEMVTHSSTRENEKELWDDLKTQLNNLKPEKSLYNWKNFWLRWRTSLYSKPESNLTLVDSKLKQFLQQIMSNTQDDNNTEIVNKKRKVKKHLTITEVNNRIIEIEKEKTKLNLEVDSNDFRILKYQNTIKLLKNENALKRKRIRSLISAKLYLNTKKREFESAQNSSEDQLTDNDEVENQDFQKRIDPESLLFKYLNFN